MTVAQRQAARIQEWPAILQQQMQPRAVRVQMGNSLHLQRRLYLVLNDFLENLFKTQNLLCFLFFFTILKLKLEEKFIKCQKA